MEETIYYKNFQVKIIPDEYPMNPRRDWDNNNEMVCFHSRYDLGDKHDFDSPKDFERFMNDMGDKILVLPLYLYDHSGITISTGQFACRWDSGQVGWIYTSIEILQYIGHGWKKWTKDRRKHALKWMQQDVKIYDNYITGQTYTCQVTDPSGKELGEDDDFYRDTFYGDDHEESGLLTEVRAGIDRYLRWEMKSHGNQLRRYIQNKIPLIYRRPFIVNC